MILAIWLICTTSAHHDVRVARLRRSTYIGFVSNVSEIRDDERSECSWLVTADQILSLFLGSSMSSTSRNVYKNVLCILNRLISRVRGRITLLARVLDHKGLKLCKSSW